MSKREIALRTIALVTMSLHEAESAGDMRAFFTLLGILRQALEDLDMRQTHNQGVNHVNHIQRTRSRV